MVFERLRQSLQEGEGVVISGFGKFCVGISDENLISQGGVNGQQDAADN
jgi:hypothetical protein